MKPLSKQYEALYLKACRHGEIYTKRNYLYSKWQKQLAHEGKQNAINQKVVDAMA